MSGPAAKRKQLPRSPSKPSLQYASRGGLKRLRTRIVSFQLFLRHPRNALIAFIATATGLALLFYVTLVLDLNPLHAHPTHGILALAHHHGKAGSAFTEQVVERKFDQVWAVQHDDGGEAAKKDLVSIAYFVQVGNDSVPMLPRLFSRLHHPRNVYVLHVDAKVNAGIRKKVENMISSSDRYAKNVFVLPSEMVTYKAISMVTNTLSAMTLALERHDSWDYFINLSGADYPLVSPDNQARLLARPRVPIGRLNCITFFPRKEWKPYSFRIRNMHWDPAAVGFQSTQSRLRLLRGQKENPLEQHRAFVFTKAEAWMILSRPFVQFVLRSAFAKRMLMNHMHILSVPEHYFADILYNHPFWRKTIVPDAFRKVVWYLRNRRSGQHPYPIDGGPKIFSRWEYIARTRSLFARKFTIPDSELLDRIDRSQSGAGLNKTDSNFEKFQHERKIFYNRIVRHFDMLTKKTLEVQGYSYPRGAYSASY